MAAFVTSHQCLFALSLVQNVFFSQLGEGCIGVLLSSSSVISLAFGVVKSCWMFFWRNRSASELVSMATASWHILQCYFDQCWFCQTLNQSQARDVDFFSQVGHRKMVFPWPSHHFLFAIDAHRLAEWWFPHVLVMSCSSLAASIFPLHR